jgi:hypothetical protein
MKVSSSEADDAVELVLDIGEGAPEPELVFRSCAAFMRSRCFSSACFAHS